jgi:5-methyltetrahydrofolate--homocysteine methyltransferase
LRNLLEEIYDNLIEGKAQEVKGLTEKALDQGFSPEMILQKSLIAAMDVVGWRFRQNEIFIPDVLMSSRAMHAGLYALKPHLVDSQEIFNARVVIGTVAGDLHDIGKNYVAMMLQGAGYQVINIGIDVPPEEFVAAVEEHQPEILGMSALLTTTMQEMQGTMELLVEKGLRDKVKVIVGGAPITREFAQAVGADGYAPDAVSAVELVKKLLGS